MKSDKKATVFYNGTPAGEIERDPSGYTFTYATDYLANAAMPAISLTLPKQQATFHSVHLFPFFFGLLSEGENKKILCRTLKIDSGDYFALLLNSTEYDTIGPITIRRVEE